MEPIKTKNMETNKEIVTLNDGTTYELTPFIFNDDLKPSIPPPISGFIFNGEFFDTFDEAMDRKREIRDKKNGR